MCEFFNNASVAAFFGAFFAFLLVIVASCFRLWWQKVTLKKLISLSRDHARRKRESVETNIALFEKKAQITGAPFMPFPVGVIRKQHTQVLTILSAAQKQSVDALIFWMKAIDDLLNDATEKGQELKAHVRANAPTQTKSALVEEYLELLREGKKNLGLLDKLCSYYVKGKPEKIIEFKHPIGGEGAS